MKERVENGRGATRKHADSPRMRERWWTEERRRGLLAFRSEAVERRRDPGAIPRRAISEIDGFGDELLALGDELDVPVLGSGHPLATSSSSVRAHPQRDRGRRRVLRVARSGAPRCAAAPRGRSTRRLRRQLPSSSAQDARRPRLVARDYASSSRSSSSRSATTIATEHAGFHSWRRWIHGPGRAPGAGATWTRFVTADIGSSLDGGPGARSRTRQGARPGGARTAPSGRTRARWSRFLVACRRLGRLRRAAPRVPTARTSRFVAVFVSSPRPS